MGFSDRSGRWNFGYWMDGWTQAELGGAPNYVGTPKQVRCKTIKCRLRTPLNAGVSLELRPFHAVPGLFIGGRQVILHFTK